MFTELGANHMHNFLRIFVISYFRPFEAATCSVYLMRRQYSSPEGGTIFSYILLYMNFIFLKCSSSGGGPNPLFNLRMRNTTRQAMVHFNSIMFLFILYLASIGTKNKTL